MMMVPSSSSSGSNKSGKSLFLTSIVGVSKSYYTRLIVIRVVMMIAAVSHRL